MGRKQIYGRFKRLIKKHFNEKTGPGLEKETLREKQNLFL